MKRFLIVDKRWIDGLKAGESSESLRAALDMVSEHFRFAGTREKVDAFRVIAEVETGEGTVGGPVEQSDFSASLDPLGHRAARALSDRGISGPIPSLQDVRVEGRGLVFKFGL